MRRWLKNLTGGNDGPGAGPAGSARVRRLAFLTGGLGGIPLLAVGSLLVYHLLSEPAGEAIYAFKEREGMVRSLVFSPDGQSLMACYLGGPLSHWNPRTGMARPSALDQLDPVFAVGLLDDHSRAILKTHRGLLGVYDQRTGELLKQLPLLVSTNLAPVIVSPDRTMVAVADGKAAFVVDIESSRVLGEVIPSGKPVRCLAFSPDSRTLAMGDESGRLTVCSTKDLGVLAGWEAHPNFINALGFSHDGATLYTGGQDGSVRSWSAADGQPGRSWGDLPGPVSSVALAPGGRWLGLACGELVARLIDLEDEGASRSLPTGQDARALVVAFSPDGRTVATGANDGSVRIWPMPDIPATSTSPPPPPSERDRTRGSRE